MGVCRDMGVYKRLDDNRFHIKNSISESMCLFIRFREWKIIKRLMEKIMGFYMCSLEPAGSREAGSGPKSSTAVLVSVTILGVGGAIVAAAVIVYQRQQNAKLRTSCK